MDSKSDSGSTATYLTPLSMKRAKNSVVDRGVRIVTIGTVNTHVMTVAEVVAAVERITAVYRAAFAGEPYNRQETEVAEFARALPIHTQREGFKFVAATNEAAGEIVGFAYGYRTQPGQWWCDNVSRALGQHAAALWLSDAFQVTELAVSPAHQGQGIGGALHDALLCGLPYGRAVLSTLDAETAGRALYRSRGWQDLIDKFYFPGVPRRYAIMGLILPEQPG